MLIGCCGACWLVLFLLLFNSNFSIFSIPLQSLWVKHALLVGFLVSDVSKLPIDLWLPEKISLYAVTVKHELPAMHSRLMRSGGCKAYLIQGVILRLKMLLIIMSPSAFLEA